MIGRDTFAVDIKSDGTVADFGSNSRDPKVYAAASNFYTGNWQEHFHPVLPVV